MATSACEDGFQFTLSTQEVGFDQASATCTLAIPTTEEKFVKMRDFAAANVPGEDVWVGLRDITPDIPAQGDGTDRFVHYLDFRANPFTSGRKGDFPWNVNQPDNVGLGEDCVEIKDFGLLNDKACTTQNIFMCEQFCEPPPTVVFENECIENVEFFTNPLLQTVDGGLADCLRVDPSATLAIPKNIAQYDRIVASCRDSQVGNPEPCWIGLIDFFHEGGLGTDRFTSMENEVLSFINVGRGVFPWREDRPNDLEGDQFCVDIKPDGVIDDSPCPTDRVSVCQRPCQTDIPTTSPTNTVTGNPTINIQSDDTNLEDIISYPWMFCAMINGVLLLLGLFLLTRFKLKLKAVQHKIYLVSEHQEKALGK